MSNKDQSRFVVPDPDTDTHNHPDSNQEPTSRYDYSVRGKDINNDERNMSTSGRQMLEDRKNR